LRSASSRGISAWCSTPRGPVHRWNASYDARHAIQKFHGDERLDKCLEKDRNLRYQHASEIRTDLQRLKRDVQPASVVSPIEADAKPRMAKMLTPTFPSLKKPRQSTKLQ
jgi:hypothetical protein